MSAKRTKGRWVVYERRNGEFIVLSRLFATRARAEKERGKLEARFTYKKVSFGVGVVTNAQIDEGRSTMRGVIHPSLLPSQK